jgi:hypothetical protein
VAEAFYGLCPPGHKLVHLNGIKSDNRLANLAYVPVSDPRPAAPLKFRPTGYTNVAKPGQVESPKPSQRVSGPTRSTGKKRRKGKKKHR